MLLCACPWPSAGRAASTVSVCAAVALPLCRSSSSSQIHTTSLTPPWFFQNHAAEHLEQHLDAIADLLAECSDADRSRVARVAQLWRRDCVFCTAPLLRLQERFPAHPPVSIDSGPNKALKQNGGTGDEWDLRAAAVAAMAPSRSLCALPPASPDPPGLSLCAKTPPTEESGAEVQMAPSPKPRKRKSRWDQD